MARGTGRFPQLVDPRSSINRLFLLGSPGFREAFRRAARLGGADATMARRPAAPFGHLEPSHVQLSFDVRRTGSPDHIALIGTGTLARDRNPSAILKRYARKTAPLLQSNVADFGQ